MKSEETLKDFIIIMKRPSTNIVELVNCESMFISQNKGVGVIPHFTHIGIIYNSVGGDTSTLSDEFSFFF